MSNLLKKIGRFIASPLVVAITIIIVLAGTLGVIGYKWNENWRIVTVPKDKEIVLVDKEHVEIVENCSVQLGPCNLIMRPEEVIPVQ